MSPKRQTSDTPTLHLSSALTRRPAISPLGLCKPSPPTPIKVKEAFQIKLMWADVGPFSWLSEDVSTQNRLRLNGPGDSRFGVSAYPPPGQCVHTLTPVCQRREQQEEEETEKRVSQSKHKAEG